MTVNLSLSLSLCPILCLSLSFGPYLCPLSVFISQTFFLPLFLNVCLFLLPSLSPTLPSLSVTVSFSSLIGSTWSFCSRPVESAAWCRKSPNLEEIWNLSFFSLLRKVYPPLLLAFLFLFSLPYTLPFSLLFLYSVLTPLSLFTLSIPLHTPFVS